MSLATRCPACGTIFRVVQDQLKVSEGWVRCGQCHEVFHGIEALFDLDSDPAIAARRAAARVAAAPPPTRVFAQQRANAPIPNSVSTPATPPASSPIVFPARTPAPPASASARQSVPASPSAFGAPDYPSAAPPTRPGYAGFTPAARPLSPPAPLPVASPAPITPTATRTTIAPRFAARLAEEAARAQASPSASAPTVAPRAPTAFGGTMIQDEPAQGWPSPQPSEDEAMPVAFAPTAPISLDELSMPMDTAPTPYAASPLAPPPAPAHAEPAWDTPVSTPSVPTPELAAAPMAVAPSATDLASAFAAPVVAPAPAQIVAPEPALDGDAAMPSSDLAEDGADEARAGPPTLASMLPEDAGDFPPRRVKTAPEAAQGELEVVDRTRDPRFLREAKSGARWRRPWVRAVLSVSLLVLVVAAAGQLAWPQRDMLASRFPATMPAWTWLCEQAGCQIEAPRAIASLALDGSSLTRTDTEHVLLFSADLHNRASHEVRTPSFDVTFMDLNGEIVARKVLTPEDIGIHQAWLPAEGELHVHARLQVGTLAASGFQADLFYP